jgi:hypothetical protein
MSKQKDTALNLAKFIDKSIIVKLAGGREGTVLKEGAMVNLSSCHIS